MQDIIVSLEERLRAGNLRALAVATIEKGEEESGGADEAAMTWAMLDDVPPWQLYGSIQVLASDVLEAVRDGLSEDDGDD